MPKRFCLECGQLYDRDATGTMRCAPCQAKQGNRDRARRARAAAGRPSSSKRGYGATYRRRRDRIVAQAKANLEPCDICGHPCKPGQDIVAHHPAGKPAAADPATAELRPAHASCNSGYRHHA